MDCNECVFYGCDSDGTPSCERCGDCPFEAQGKVVINNGVMTVSIDLGDMQTRIESAFLNTIDSQVSSTVTRLVQDKFGDKIKEKTAEAIESLLVLKVAEFMEQPIHIGGWQEPERTLTRNEYLTELVEKRLKSNFDQEQLAKTIANNVKSNIDKFTRATQEEVNRSIKDMFNAAMRANLTDSIVAMLMDNDTYRKLSGSMQHLIGSSEKD